uniref:Uncharacterized protein n=1 Tax=Rhizophora mucronata TaxID=61149 RepID=A0A2P2QBM2_RHIMU
MNWASAYSKTVPGESERRILKNSNWG